MTTSRTPDPSPKALAARIRALELRMDDIEGPVLAGQYELRRQVTGLRITLGRLAEQAGVRSATDAEIDAELDNEA